MGMVKRNGSGVRVLMLYREAIDPSPYPLPEAGRGEEVDVMAIVEGYAADVRCSICGNVRTWVPGEEAMRALIRRAKRMQTV
jgi:hypothetical protein